MEGAAAAEAVSSAASLSDSAPPRPSFAVGDKVMINSGRGPSGVGTVTRMRRGSFGDPSEPYYEVDFDGSLARHVPARDLVHAPTGAALELAITRQELASLQVQLHAMSAEMRARDDHLEAVVQQNSFLRRDAIFSAGVDPRPAAAAGGLASAPAAEDQIRIFMAKASAYSWMHDRAYAFNSRNALFTTVLVTLVSYVSGGIALSTAGDPSTWLTVFTAVLTLFAGAVAALAKLKYFNYEAVTQQHSDALRQWAKFAEACHEALLLPEAMTKKSGVDQLAWLLPLWADLTSTSQELLPRWVRRECVTVFRKNDRGGALPTMCTEFTGRSTEGRSSGSTDRVLDPSDSATEPPAGVPYSQAGLGKPTEGVRTRSTIVNASVSPSRRGVGEAPPTMMPPRYHDTVEFPSRTGSVEFGPSRGGGGGGYGGPSPPVRSSSRTPPFDSTITPPLDPSRTRATVESLRAAPAASGRLGGGPPIYSTDASPLPAGGIRDTDGETEPLPPGVVPAPGSISGAGPAGPGGRVQLRPLAGLQSQSSSARVAPDPNVR